MVKAQHKARTKRLRATQVPFPRKPRSLEASENSALRFARYLAGCPLLAIRVYTTFLIFRKSKIFENKKSPEFRQAIF
jgi:hypothetical protein